MNWIENGVPILQNPQVLVTLCIEWLCGWEADSNCKSNCSWSLESYGGPDQDTASIQTGVSPPPTSHDPGFITITLTGQTQRSGLLLLLPLVVDRNSKCYVISWLKKERNCKKTTGKIFVGSQNANIFQNVHTWTRRLFFLITYSKNWLKNN